MEPCKVKLCPAMPESRGLCRQHQYADTAKYLGVAGRICIGCRRKMNRDDYVLVDKDDATDGYRHVACEPVKPRASTQTIRESPKPLLEGL